MESVYITDSEPANNVNKIYKELYNYFKIKVTENAGKYKMEKGKFSIKLNLLRERLRFTYKIFFDHCEKIYKHENKKIIPIITGLGGGAWLPEWLPEGPEGEDLFGEIVVDIVLSILNEKPDLVKNIAILHFSSIVQKKNIDNTVINEYTNIPKLEFTHFANDKNYKIPMFKSKVDLNDDNVIQVAVFAWDGNSYVGNEYYDGAYAMSGDPAAAACSCIAELVNPYINIEFIENINRCGDIKLEEKANKVTAALLAEENVNISKSKNEKEEQLKKDNLENELKQLTSIRSTNKGKGKIDPNILARIDEIKDELAHPDDIEATIRKKLREEKKNAQSALDADEQSWGPPQKATRDTPGVSSGGNKSKSKKSKSKKSKSKKSKSKKSKSKKPIKNR